MTCLEIFEVLGMYVLKSGLTWTSTSSHSSISRSACISWDRDPLHHAYWNSDWWISISLGPRFLWPIFYSGENIVALACQVSLGDSFLFCRIGLKNKFYCENNIPVLACLVSLWVNFFQSPELDQTIQTSSFKKFIQL